jgi:carbon-monoxide dehydrogenase large subunit
VWRAIEDARAGTPADPWREPPAAFATLPVRERKQPHRDDEIDL